ncbi:iron chelate uptake ABC transporter family permease subunit [Pseudonocardia sp. N23]|uniref:FecCD family ABC transporter permease n=1 Tax=Pseudonocardia sp. N23 TaxID=1987376 RepID=UPI000BFB2FBD|nr:iron chelate uptake ABC transporter family permease subunit [Pseudonocardia sp. N23]GAY08796.1 ABC-type Fe3+-siderophore transport system, permease 2 component [Pseudonocardia sp. N23]
MTVTKPPPAPALLTGRVLRSRSGRLSVRAHPRSLVVGGVLVVVVLVVAVLMLVTGDYPATVGEVVRTVFGDGPPGLELIVNRFRMPRILVGIAVGVALGVSGAIFQSLSRNPLGSPDIIGFTTGSATGALLVILVFRDTMSGTAGGAIAGGVVTSLVVYMLAFKRGVSGFRLILIGIGVSAMLASVNAFLLSRATLRDAQNAQLWLVGSLNARGWQHVVPVWTAIAALLPIAVVLGKRMMMLEMGDEAAAARGVPVERSRLALLLTAVGLTAVATAAAGPVGFVALAAPQVARRLTGSTGAGLLPAALTGAALLTAADLAGQRLIAPTQLPVGLTTGAIGGLYLAVLLGREWRKGRS